MRVPILDPKSVPLDPEPAPGLPALPASLLTPAALRQRFARLQTLRPGAWQPEFRADGVALGTVDPKPAAVLIPLVNRGDRLGLVLTVRSASLSKHSGQVAFPGGRVDPEDETIASAALREAREEIGLDGEAVDVLGMLPHYTTGTGYTVTPVVGLVDDPAALQHLRPEPAEVADVFEVPLGFLMDPANHRRHRFRWTDGAVEHERHFFSMPWQPGPDTSREYFIWGATAAMLRNFYHFLAAR